MGFDMFAWGFRGYKSVSKAAREPFHYSKKNCLSQGDFEPPALLSMVPDSPNAAGVAKKIVGTPESHVGGATVKGMMKIAEMEFAHLVSTGVTLLAMNGSGGNISVYCFQKKWYWADANNFETFYYSTSVNPGKDFLKTISPGLVKTELNDFGVLGQIAIVLSEYNRKLPNGVAPILRMEISH
ncbi:MAG TPA: hypothetical protein VMM38_01060 [Aridibacter sp.]|nr:hypothetical protein [Aridibacter sp.]